MPCIRLSCHACPLQGQTETAFSRYTVTPTNTRTKYCPVRLSDAHAADMQQKRAVLGAVYMGRMATLQLTTNLAKVVWELELRAEPPAMYRPVKPKLYFVGELTLLRGRYYRLI